jgi:hypothetical protein
MIKGKCPVLESGSPFTIKMVPHGGSLMGYDARKPVGRTVIGYGISKLRLSQSKQHMSCMLSVS